MTSVKFSPSSYPTSSLKHLARPFLGGYVLSFRKGKKKSTSIVYFSNSASKAPNGTCGEIGVNWYKPILQRYFLITSRCQPGIRCYLICLSHGFTAKASSCIMEQILRRWSIRKKDVDENDGEHLDIRLDEEYNDLDAKNKHPLRMKHWKFFSPVSFFPFFLFKLSFKIYIQYLIT